MESKIITVKLNFEIQFKKDSKFQQVDFKRFIGILENLNKIHNGVIKECCDDDSKPGKNYKLLKEHILQLEEIQYGNTLKISLFFGCDVKTFCLYFSIIKEILNVCEIYAGRTDKARITIAGIQNAVINLLKKINEKSPKILHDSKFNEIEKEITNGKTIGSLIQLLEDPKFKNHYNKLCSRTTYISKFTLFYNNIEETLIDK